MFVKKYDLYTLICSYDPADIFRYYGVKQMHGLSLDECVMYNNTVHDAYIAGLCNVNPHNRDEFFVFINLSRCSTIVDTVVLLFHEFTHLASNIFNYDWIEREEEMITFAETETLRNYKIINLLLNGK